MSPKLICVRHNCGYDVDSVGKKLLIMDHNDDPDQLYRTDVWRCKNDPDCKILVVANRASERWDPNFDVDIHDAEFSVTTDDISF